MMMVSTEQDIVDNGDGGADDHDVVGDDEDVVVGRQQQGEHEWSRGVK